MRIDRPDPADEAGDAHMGRRPRPTPDDLDAAGKDRSTAASVDTPDSSSADPDSALRTERSVVYHAEVVAIYRQHAIDRGYARSEKLERETAVLAERRTEAEHPDSAREAAPLPVDNGGDVPDDPRIYSNPKTGRLDASWSTYDRAITAAREHAGGDLGPDSSKMYDYNSEAGEGTGTLIGEQTSDRLRGWRIDSQDGHMNWWDWTGGKKGAGGAYGHDWFSEDTSAPGSRYIGWAPWQDVDGNILEGN